MKKTKLALHWQIIIAMILGIVWGILSSALGWNVFTSDWIKPLGTIFINLLKLIAMPLVLFSLIGGIGNLKDISKLSRIGGKTLGIYISTTVMAVIVGLVLVNIAQPGKFLTEDTRDRLVEQYKDEAVSKQNIAAEEEEKEKGPLAFFVDLVPQNVFSAATSNKNMLQIILFAFLIGVALVLIEPHKSAPVMDVVNGLSEAVIKMVDMIMVIAPIGVFALLAAIIADTAGDDPMNALNILGVLGYYSIVVVVGLAILAFVMYPLLLRTFTKYNIRQFFKAIRPAQLLAFSTSSSAATLPVTMDRVENNVGVTKDIVGFVLPVGATVNMDGTSLYQGIAAVFIAQAFGIDLTLMDQLSIVLTATLASIGSAAVPSAGLVMLVVVLETINVPAAGIGLIFAMDRILDMCRTVVNVTGDATVATIVAYTENGLVPPEVE